MKNLILSKSLLITILITAFFTTCKRKEANFLENKLGPQEMGLVPSGASPQYIEKQLTWIARVLPYVANNNTTFKTNFHNQLAASPLLQRFNFQSQVSLLTTPINYFNSVNSALSLNFVGNNFDTSMFYTFMYDDCLHKTTVRILNQDNLANFSTKTLVCIAEYETLKDTLTGYYFNTNTSKLDSLNLHEDNVDSFYVWVVSADNDCLDDDDPLSFTFNPEGHCGNGACEPWLGETPENCSECADKRVSGKYTLIMKELQHLNDNKVHPSQNDLGDWAYDRQYMERYFTGKYDIFFQYAVVSGCPNADEEEHVKDAWYLKNVVRRQFARDWYVDNNDNETKKWSEIMLARLNVGKGHVIREHKRASGNTVLSGSGTNLNLTVNKIMSFDFDPIEDYIYLNMVEWDQGRTVNNDDQDLSLCKNDQAWWFPRYRGLAHRESTQNDLSTPERVPYYWGRLNPVGTWPTINEYWLDGSTLYGNGSFYIDLIHNNYINMNNIPWNDYSICVPWSPRNLQKSEMRIRFVLLPNP